MADPRGERRHPAGAASLWAESWYFDFVSGAGDLGGYVRLGLYPNLGVAWYWAYLVGEGRPLVAVRDHSVDLPRGDALEVRAEGLWSAVTCETPHEHWSIGLEAFAVGMDDPLDAYRGERGDRVPLGFDLEWESAAPTFDYPGASRYVQACRVNGQVLVGRERLDLDGFGQREHAWGMQDWWAFPWCWAAGRLEDGTTLCGYRAEPDTPSLETGCAGQASRAGSAGQASRAGYLGPPNGPCDAVASVDASADLGPEGLPATASLILGEASLVLTPQFHAPVLLEAGDGRQSRLPRSLCRLQTADGRTGVGWAEWLQPTW